MPLNCTFPPRTAVVAYDTVPLIIFASKKFIVKVHLNDKSGGRKLDGDGWGIEFPIDYRQVFFFWLRLFSGVNFYEQSPGTHLHHTDSLVGLPDPVIFIFHRTCTGTLVPVLPVEVCWQKFTWRKIRRSKNFTVIDRKSTFLSVPVEFFRLRCFLEVDFSQYWLSGARMGWGSHFHTNFI